MSRGHRVPTVPLNKAINAPYPQPTWLDAFSFSQRSNPIQLHFSNFTFFLWPLNQFQLRLILPKTYLSVTSTSDSTGLSYLYNYQSLFQWKRHYYPHLTIQSSLSLSNPSISLNLSFILVLFLQILLYQILAP